MDVIQLPLGNHIEPSVTLCSKDCGARCCRAPHSLEIRHGQELRTFRKNAAANGRQVIAVKSTATVSIVTFDGSCPVLNEATNLCSAYMDRPEACRLYPKGPAPDCLAWPGLQVMLEIEDVR